MWGCGGVEQSEKKKKKKRKKKKKEKDEKRIFGCFEKTSRRSFSFSLLLKSNHFNHSSPNSPKNTSLSLWRNTQTHTSLTHIYHTNQQPFMSSPEIQITPKLILIFQTTHSISLPLSFKTIISLVNPQNQSHPPFSLIHLIGFKNVIE